VKKLRKPILTFMYSLLVRPLLSCGYPKEAAQGEDEALSLALRSV
jgi:hypothetical protein